jgi:hypothetical protein
MRGKEGMLRAGQRWKGGEGGDRVQGGSEIKRGGRGRRARGKQSV